MILALLTILMILLWLCLVPGYPFWLKSWKVVQEKPDPASPSLLPPVDVVMAVWNEILLIRQKLKNLQELQYPRDLVKFWIVDGGSSDGTRELLRELVGKGQDPRFQLIEVNNSDKILQLNAALEHCRGEWVMATDADALLGPDTLMKLVLAGQSTQETAVMGTPVETVGAYFLDQLHWEIADRLRVEEGARGYASIVTGVCYLFRRDLLKSFPPDVIADDVHIAFAAFRASREVRYVSCDVKDLRCPGNLMHFLRHKRRKAHNYLIEVFRFLPSFRLMPRMARRIFLFRAAQIILGPLLVFGSVLSFLISLRDADLRVVGLSVVVAMVVATVAALWFGKKRLGTVSLGISMSLVLLFNLLAYPLTQYRSVKPFWRLPDTTEKNEMPAVETKKGTMSRDQNLAP